MPNWCDCDLYIKGPKDHLEEFLKSVRSEDSLFDFGQLVPYPRYYLELDQVADAWRKKPPEERTEPCPLDGYNQGGYGWCIRHWGTKWNAVEVQEGKRAKEWRRHDTTFQRVVLHFQTAWSPPLPVIVRASQCCPELVFDLRFFECGAAFQGRLICKHGEVTHDETRSYSGNRGG
jgi:Ferredoxin-like domain in Api92-like protein